MFAIIKSFVIAGSYGILTKLAAGFMVLFTAAIQGGQYSQIRSCLLKLVHATPFGVPFAEFMSFIRNMGSSLVSLLQFFVRHKLNVLFAWLAVLVGLYFLYQVIFFSFLCSITVGALVTRVKTQGRLP